MPRRCLFDLIRGDQLFCICLMNIIYIPTFLQKQTKESQKTDLDGRREGFFLTLSFTRNRRLFMFHNQFTCSIFFFKLFLIN